MTRTRNGQEFVLPQESVAMTVTVFEPSGKKDPETGELVTEGAGSQVSVAVPTLKLTKAAPESRGFSATIILVEQITTGTLVSRMTTVVSQVRGHALLVTVSVKVKFEPQGT